MRANGKTVWTPEMDAKLRRLWGRRTRLAIGREMGLTEMRVRNRAWFLELPPSKPLIVRQPTKQEWIWEASLSAAKHGVSLNALLNGSRIKAPALARWEAFKATLDRYPHCSIAGLGRVSGFHHTTIMSALKQLEAGVGPHRFSGKYGFVKRSAQRQIPQCAAGVREFAESSLLLENALDGLPRNASEAA